MAITRREFVRGGVAAFTVSFAAPAFLSDLARAQGRSRRNLVVLYLSGGNDALSTLIPYNDPQYRSRRPTIAIPAATCCRSAPIEAGTALGLHPRLTGLRTIFNAGRLALIQRTGYRTRAARISRNRHLVDRRSRDRRRATDGSVGISTRCRRRSIR